VLFKCFFRQKNVSCEIAIRASFAPLDTAAAVLAKQEWYRSSELASVVRIITYLLYVTICF
jgi:hypothetical protein